MSMETELGEEHRKGMLYYGLKKLQPHLVKDMRKIPETQLISGMGRIARKVLAAVEPELDAKNKPSLSVVSDEPEPSAPAAAEGSA